MKIYFSFICTLFSLSATCQNCEVAVPNLQGKYSGDCKSNKANGQGKAEGIDAYEGTFKSGYPSGEGTYTYKSGDYYTGVFKKGLKDGKGEFHYKRPQGDSVVNGYWKNDLYIGTYATPYSILKKSEGLYNVEISPDGGQVGKITIVSENLIKSNSLGSNTPPVVPVITYINIEDGGSFEREEKLQQPRSSTYTLYGVKFPFRAKVNYLSESFEVLISKPAAWRINVQVSSQ